MLVYRLSRKAYKDQLSGFGASLHGQRWNSKGTEVIYTAASRALAFSEVAVHIPLGILPSDYYMLEISIPAEAAIERLEPSDYPRGWNTHPPSPSSQFIGDNFVRSKQALVLGVPSVVVSGDINYLINPHHPDFEQVSIVGSAPFPFDSRLFKK